MKELIEQLKQEAGISEEQANKALQILTAYIHTKVPPMFSGFVDNFFKNNDDDLDGHSAFLAKAKEVEQEANKKIENITEEAKEDIEDFARVAAERIDEWAVKADGAAKDALDKLKDIINDPKNGGAKS